MKRKESVEDLRKTSIF